MVWLGGELRDYLSGVKIGERRYSWEERAGIPRGEHYTEKIKI